MTSNASPAFPTVPPRWEWKLPLAVWLISSLLTQGWGGLVRAFLPFQPAVVYYFGVLPLERGWQGWALGIWQRWDAIHYQRIAQSGYAEEMLGAFFPLYPLLGRSVATLTHTHVLVGLLVVGNLAFLGALILLYRLTSDWFSEDLARMTLIFLVLFPSAYFFHGPFTESLALLLVLAALICARRNRWAAAGAVGLLAGLTRGTVYPLSGALLWMAWMDEKSLPVHRRLVRVLVSGAPLIGNWLFFQWLLWNGFRSFGQIKQTYWHQSAAPPWVLITDLLSYNTSVFISPAFWYNLAVLVFVVIITAWGWKILPGTLRIYQIALIALVLINRNPHTPIYSFGRFALLMFPNYILLAAWAKTPARRLIAVSSLFTVQLIISWMFFNWVWTN